MYTRRVFLAVGLFATIILCICLYAHFYRHQRPIEFDQYLYDLGVLPSNACRTVQCRFTNHTNSAAIVEEIVSPCGCLAATNTGQPIMPDETGLIDVVYTTFGVQVSERIARVLTVKFRGENIQPVSFSVAAAVEEEIGISPNPIVIGGRGTRSVHVTIRRGKSLSRDEFATLQIKVPNCIALGEIVRSADIVEFAVTPTHEELPSYAPPLKVTWRRQLRESDREAESRIGMSPSDSQYRLVSVHTESVTSHLAVEQSFCTVKSTVSESELEVVSCQKVGIRSKDRSEWRIKKIDINGDADQWLASSHDGTTGKIWLKGRPPGTLFVGKVAITCEQKNGEIELREHEIRYLFSE